MEYSPALSLATGLFEVSVAAWILRRQDDRPLRVHLSALLLLLAGYQFLEAFICTGGGGGGYLSRVAFADVVWLPPVGISLLVLLRRPESRWPRQTARIFLGGAGLWTLIALSTPQFTTRTVCDVVFATYTHGIPWLYEGYAAFYDLGLMVLVFGGLAATATCRDHRRRVLLGAFTAGNTAFILAGLLIIHTFPSADGAAPSILCHTAISLAVSIAWMGWRLDPEEARTRPGRWLTPAT